MVFTVYLNSTSSVFAAGKSRINIEQILNFSRKSITESLKTRKFKPHMAFVWRSLTYFGEQIAEK